MQIDRLLGITNILIEKQNVTAKYLAECFGVSTKTIYRDIDTLTLAGIPIITIKGKNGGIRILDNYKISKSFLKNNEQDDIIKGLELMKALNYGKIDTTLSKLKGLFSKKEFNLIEVEFSQWESDKTMEKKFSIVKEALFNEKALFFSYFDNYGKKSQRKVYPLKLVFKEKHWYLSGYCLKRKDYRFFKISKMLDIKGLEESFHRSGFFPPPIPNEIQWRIENFEIELIFSSSVQSQVYEDFSIEKITKLDNGSLLVKDKFYVDKWLYGYLLSFGTDVKVVNPTKLKNEFSSFLQEVINSYKDNL